MSVLPDHRSKTSAAYPEKSEVFENAVERIQQAAAELWPGEAIVLEQHVPSVTSYVHRVRVGDRLLFAKVSYLGVSLVSLLRGACGGWSQVVADQLAYARRPESLVEREAAQLRLLHQEGRPRVCVPAGVCGGVLFTEGVGGPTLTDLLLARPGDAGELLAGPLRELEHLHRPPAFQQLGSAGVIRERSIAGTFQRKFNGLSGEAYLDRLGVERCAPQRRRQAVRRLHRTVARLQWLGGVVLAPARTVLAYGDLKPEHVLFPDGPDGRPVLLDPALLRTSPTADLAKLVSRTVLVLAAHQPHPATVREIVEGIDTLVRRRTQRMARQDRHAWLRELLVLWLMDTVNIVSTYLGAPAALPVPGQAEALALHPGPLCAVVDGVSAALSASADPDGVWEQAVALARQVVAR